MYTIHQSNDIHGGYSMLQYGKKYTVINSSKLKVGTMVAVNGVELTRSVTGGTRVKYSNDASFVMFKHTNELSRYLSDNNAIVAIKAIKGLDVCMGHHVIDAIHIGQQEVSNPAHY